MNKEIYRKYAQLVIKVGINLQPGQDVVIDAPTSASDFVKEVVQVCYENHARHITIDWQNDEIEKLRWMYEDESVMSEVLPWEKEKLQHRMDTLPCKIRIYNDDPEIFNDIDADKMAVVNKTRMSIVKRYRDFEVLNTQWVIVQVPSVGWAKRIFPDLSNAQAEEKLWELVIDILKLKTDNPAKEWADHLESLAYKADYLNNLQLDYLVYTSANGTDLKVKLHPQHVWLVPIVKNINGIEYTANLPTEEVFTMPKRDGVDGIVVSTKPLSLNGQLIENFKITFKDGKAVDVTAEKGLEALENMLDMDENSRHLGEVSLVPFDSPINNTGILFRQTLFDENACSHFAFGFGLKNNIKDYEKLNEEDFRNMGFNYSINHVDFMIGSADLDVVGYDFNGNPHQIFKNGTWAF